MAEPPPKRRREDSGAGKDSDDETTKRQKNTYTNNQQETTQDLLLLDFITNLSSDPFLDFNSQPEPDPDTHPNMKQELVEDDDEKERVIRHLLEASDDELGIPSRVDGVNGGGDGGDGGGDSGDGGDEVVTGDMLLGLYDGYGLWEIEDEAANYYTLLQSELFMQ